MAMQTRFGVAVFAAGMTLVLLYLLQLAACLALELFTTEETCLCSSGHLLRVLELGAGAVMAAAGAQAVTGK
jgi:hypothetical protein